MPLMNNSVIKINKRFYLKKFELNKMNTNKIIYKEYKNRYEFTKFKTMD